MNAIHHPSPVGPLKLVSEEGALVACEFTNGEKLIGKPQADAIIDQTRRELDAFFAGRLKKFTLKLNPRGTEFQLAVWKALQTIPFGKTWSYGELAKRIGKPKAMRAVGAANGQNRIAIIIPCHRVIGADGSLTGFGGGLERKQFLLALEQGEAPLL
ncbi:MAG: methylated-DNA--[protein]-cysteine S-methyltransferase [Hyphomonadaceae bacterium]|nr:methylated-DNA--[protein]-cysteine S-methyltransferase [Hyphomonadaceae bacterium]